MLLKGRKKNKELWVEKKRERCAFPPRVCSDPFSGLAGPQNAAICLCLSEPKLSWDLRQ